MGNADKEELGIVKGLLPVVGIGTAVVVVFAVLVQAFALGRRVNGGQYLVSVRYPLLQHDLRSFVQPGNPDVLGISSQYPDSWSLYDWVCRNISYTTDVGEFWQVPSETLKRGEGDCDDTAILLTSLLRAGGSDAHVAIGEYQGYGHAWTVIGDLIYETTYTRARPVPDPQDYCTYVLFNDQEVLELWPGAMDEVLGLQRDEELKLSLMAGVVDGVA